MKVKNSNVELTVKNLETSINFYQNMVGFKLVASDEEDGKIYWALLDFDGFSLSLKEDHKQRLESPFLEGRSIGGTMLLCFEVEDIQVAYAAIKSKFETLNRPHLTPCGATDFSMQDPDGYIITFQELQ